MKSASLGVSQNWFGMPSFLNACRIIRKVSLSSCPIGASHLSASIPIVPAQSLHHEFETVLIAISFRMANYILHQSFSRGTQVVGMPGLQARPLGGGTSIGTHMLLALSRLWPAGRRVLPRLLPPVDGQVEQTVAVIHRLDAATRGPARLEDIGSSSQVANDVHHAHPA